MELNYIYNNMNLEKYKEKFEKLQNIIGKDAKVILEIGGHYGEDTLRFYKYFPNSKIYTFEPDPRNIEIIKKTCSNIDSIKLIERAVSNVSDKELEFYQVYNKKMEDNLQEKYKYIGNKTYKNLKLSGSGASSLKNTNRTDLNIHNKIIVKSIKLDNWCKKKDMDVIDFIWIDVQGAEKEVIEGAKNILPNVKYIQLEYGETSYEGGLSKKQTYDMMINNNFKLIMDYNPNSQTGDYLFKNPKF